MMSSRFLFCVVRFSMLSRLPAMFSICFSVLSTRSCRDLLGSISSSRRRPFWPSWPWAIQLAIPKRWSWGFLHVKHSEWLAPLLQQQLWSSFSCVLGSLGPENPRESWISAEVGLPWSSQSWVQGLMNAAGPADWPVVGQMEGWCRGCQNPRWCWKPWWCYPLKEWVYHLRWMEPSPIHAQQHSRGQLGSRCQHCDQMVEMGVQQRWLQIPSSSPSLLVRSSPLQCWFPRLFLLPSNEQLPK